MPANAVSSLIAILTAVSLAHAWSGVSYSTPNHTRQTFLNAAADGDGLQEKKHSGYNVLGTELSCCCSDVRGSGIGTGFYRNGYCSTGEMDLGRHTVCVRVTDDFLAFSTAVGNDLSTPMHEYNFPGLKDGDIWCLCAQRWAQAHDAGKAPRLFLQATHEKTLDFIPLEVMRIFAIDAQESNTVIDTLNSQRSQLNYLLAQNKDEAGENSSFQ